VSLYRTEYGGDYYYGHEEKGEILTKQFDLSASTSKCIKRTFFGKSTIPKPLEGKQLYYNQACHCKETYTTYYWTTSGQIVKQVNVFSIGEDLGYEYYYFDEELNQWIKFNLGGIPNVCLSCEIKDLMKNIGIQFANGVYNYGLPAIQIAAAIITIATIPFTGGSTAGCAVTLLVSAYSIGQGAITLGFRLSGNDKLVSELPPNLCGGTVGLVIKSAVDDNDKFFTVFVDIACSAAEGILTMNFKNPKPIEKLGNGFTVVGIIDSSINSINSINNY
jgi:hypothetical protein